MPVALPEITNPLEEIAKDEPLAQPKAVTRHRGHGGGAECVRKLLSLLSPSRCVDYADWLAAGMVCHQAGLPVEAWCQWSQGCPDKYDEIACLEKWDSFSADTANPITVGSMVQWAADDTGRTVADIQREITPASNAGRPQIAVISATDWLTSEPPAPDQIITDTFDRGDKVALIGSSKLRKSFLLLQLSISIAAGRDCLDWQVPKHRRVFLFQMEIQNHHFHRRVRRMAQALSISPEDLQDRLQIVNARGMTLAGPEGFEVIGQVVEPLHPDLICFDPLYKVATGVENAAEDMKKTMALFDALAEKTGAAVLYVHHDCKGHAGDRDIRDRGSGSNVVGRDYDACFTLTPHATEEDAAVVESLLRNYRPQEPVTISWTEDPDTHGYCFDLRPDLAPRKKTSQTARTADAANFETCHPVALQLIEKGPILIGDFKDLLRQKTRIGQKRIDRYVRWALTKAGEPLDVYEVRGKGRHKKHIGTPEQIEALRNGDH